MTIHLPYQLAAESDFEQAQVATEIFTWVAARGQQQAATILAKLINDLAAHPEYAAVCLIEGRAHGYDVQNLLLQSRNGTVIRRQWLGVNETNETDEPVTSVELNLVAELWALRESQFILRDANFVNDDMGGTPGRYLCIYLATEYGGEWLSCPGPLSGHIYKSNPITRIYRSMWDIELA